MISSSNCIGCQACADLCPNKAITYRYDEWGEGRSDVDISLCINCGFCEQICPSLNNKFNEPQKSVYAAISKKNRKTGSSGGIFYELASDFINDGGVVFGAAFDSTLRLIHRKACTLEELSPLCKSKYLHSNMSGVYNDISECLKQGYKVMFVGTPCQVSAIRNAYEKKYDEQLFLVDFLCHGTGTQKCFDMSIRAEEKKRKGKIIDFSFRAKTKRYPHSFKYTVKNNDKEKIIKGYCFEFPYYNSYLKYNIFNEYCYECKFAREERVGDITIGDFWGIRNYDRKLKEYRGVSMLSVNTSKGRKKIDVLKSCCDMYEYPIENASRSNQAFKECVGAHCHNSKRELHNILLKSGEDALIEKMSCTNSLKERIYLNLPQFVKDLKSKRKIR